MCLLTLEGYTLFYRRRATCMVIKHHERAQKSMKLVFEAVKNGIVEIHPSGLLFLKSGRFTQVPYFHFSCHLHTSASPAQLWTQWCGNRPHASEDEMIFFLFSTPCVQTTIGPATGCPTPLPSLTPRLGGWAHTPPVTPLQGALLIPVVSCSSTGDCRLYYGSKKVSKNNCLCVIARLKMLPTWLQ